MVDALPGFRSHPGGRYVELGIGGEATLTKAEMDKWYVSITVFPFLVRSRGIG